MKKFLVLTLIALLSFSFISCGNNEVVNDVDNSNDTVNNDNTVNETNNNDSNEVVDANCNSESSDESRKLRIATLKGPTGMGMVELMENSDSYSVEVLPSPDKVVGMVLNDEADIFSVPTNLASVLYNKTEGNITLLNVNTLGVLFLVQSGNDIETIDDLKGKTVISSGKGFAPEFVFDYILSENKIKDDVDVQYKAEHSEVSTLLVAGEEKYGVLPQPFVTASLIKNEDLSIALDLTKEWKDVTDGDELPMGCVIVKKSFLEENEELVKKFLEDYKKSIEFVNQDPDAASELIEKHGILPKKAIAKKAIPFCNIVFIKANEAKDSILKFYEVLKSYEPKSIGGKLPDEDFFYE